MKIYVWQERKWENISFDTMQNDRELKGARIELILQIEWNETVQVMETKYKTEQGQKYPKLHGISYSTCAN